MKRNVVNMINPYDAGMFPEDLARKYGLKEPQVIQLASNENPFPPSKQVEEEYMKGLQGLNRYPHPYYNGLKEALSSYLQVDKANIAVGNGAGDILRYMCDVVVDALDQVTIPLPSFTLYAIFAMMRDASINFIEFPHYRINADEIPDSKLLFLCSPNNPTGNTIPLGEVERILKKQSGYVILDEAYAEFSGKTGLDLVDKYDNLVVVRTFSKFFALAGLRIGYAVGNESIINAMERTRPPFCISSVASKVGIAALNSIDHYRGIRDKIIEERERLARELEEFDFLEVYPSEANFLLIKANKEGISKRLEEKGMIIRNLSGLMGLDGTYIRITVGTEEENNMLLKFLQEQELDH
ncbi:MAG: histidinol-phosphate transaminase [Archaeoglobaceae archaeon]